jgi:hypothetical protein
VTAYSAASPSGASDLRRRPVLEEVEDREEPAEDREGDAESGELGPSEMTDDRSVDEEIERLRSEGAQRGEREPHDLAVVRRAQPHARPSPGLAPATERK